MSHPIAVKRVATYPSILCLYARAREPIAVRASCELLIGAFAALRESVIGQFRHRIGIGMQVLLGILVERLAGLGIEALGPGKVIGYWLPSTRLPLARSSV
jgi:hypothetical protein